MSFRIAPAVFIADDGKTFAKCRDEFGSRINHEWTRIYTNDARIRKDLKSIRDYPYDFMVNLRRACGTETVSDGG